MSKKFKKAGSFKILENVTIERFQNGKLLDRIKTKNTVVNAGLEFMAKIAGGISANTWGYIGIGTGTTAVQNSDTALETSVTREAADVTYEASYKLKLEKTFSFGSGENYDITEAGVFDAAASGNMLNRFTFSARSVDSETTLKVTVTITFARV